jgi:ABC-2 type transport system ATP-binding protein
MIKVENVCKTLKGRPVLEGVSLQVSPGEIVGLSGVNGSGKTMLLRMIAGLVKPTSGRIFVDGAEVKPGSFPPSVGALIENPAFLPNCTGLKNLQLLASIKGVATASDCVDALHAVGLDPQDVRTFKKYSLGMKQRLGLACALMEKPQVVLLDEPTNALDPNGVEIAKTEILKARNRGAAVCVACHDAGFLDSISNRVISLAEGHIVGEHAGAAATFPQDLNAEGCEATNGSVEVTSEVISNGL